LKFDFQPTTERDAHALSEFLRKAFELRAESPLLHEQHMVWKYWTPRPDWEGSRSFVGRLDGVIVAHAAVWPVRVRAPGNEVTAVHVIDWAGNRNYPGIGGRLMKHIAANAPMMIATGGSDIARRILPVLGFRPHGELCLFARPVRPLGQALTTAHRDYKLPARVLRNAYWCFSHRLSVPPGWSAKPLAPDEVPQGLWPQPSPAKAVTARDPDLYRYFLASPAAPHQLFGLQNGHQLVGYFCLAFVPHVARIADLWLPSTQLEDWCAGYQTAAALAAGDKQIYEITACGSTELAKQALAGAGFLVRGRSAVSLRGAANALKGREMHLQMLDSDASFLTEGSVSYLT